MHTLGATLRTDIEICGAGFLEAGLELARSRSWEALRAIRRKIRPGMTEAEACGVAARTLRDLGSPRSWHRPIVRIGANTCLSYREKGDPGRKLEPGGLFYIDIGPTWEFEELPGVEYEGDVGETFLCDVGDSVGPRLIEACKRLHEEARAHWTRNDISGDALYAWMDERAREMGFSLVPDDDGHRIGDFPHSRFTQKGLREVAFRPSSHLWVLEVHLIDQESCRGAFFEDLLVP